MRNWRLRLLSGLLLVTGLALTSGVGTAQFTLNEVRLDQSGADNDEFVEILGPALTSLANLSFIVLGDSGAAVSGVVEEIIDLGAYSTDSNGLFTMAEATCTTCGGGCPDEVLTINLENGDNVTYLLVENRNPALTDGPSGFGGSLVDADQNGFIDATGDWDGDSIDDGPPWDSIVDCVSLIGGDPLLSYCATTAGPDGSFLPGHVFVCADSSEWVVGEFSDLQFDTPCEENGLCGVPSPAFVDLARDPCVPNENQATTISVTAVNGVDAGSIDYSVNGGGIQNVALTVDGTSADTTFLSGSIPGQAPDETLVEYTVNITNTSEALTTVSFQRGYFVGTTEVATLRVNDANERNIYDGYGARVNGNVTAAYSIFSGTNTDWYLQDATGGINVFKFGPHSVQPGLGDDVTVEGQLDQFNGKLEISSGGDCDTVLVEINGAGSPPAPTEVLTCDLNEDDEGLLVRIVEANFIFETAGDTLMNNNSYLISNCFPGIDIFADADTDVPGLILATPFINIVGIAGQFDFSPPFRNNYQIVPRARTDITFLDAGAAGDPGARPTARLLQNQPNPFGTSTTIRFEVPRVDTPSGLVPVRLLVFDLAGRVVSRLIDGEMEPGDHTVSLTREDMDGLPNGIYFYRLEAADKRLTRKLTLMR